eukprot:UN01944
MPHKMFQPQQFIPHENRNPTLLSLHRIPGISEWFIKSEDDYFLTSNIDIYDYFFSIESQKAYVIEERCPDRNANDGWRGAQRKAIEVISDYFGESYSHECYGAFWHTPVVYNKAIGEWFRKNVSYLSSQVTIHHTKSAFC